MDKNIYLFAFVVLILVDAIALTGIKYGQGPFNHFVIGGSTVIYGLIAFNFLSDSKKKAKSKKTKR